MGLRTRVNFRHSLSLLPGSVCAVLRWPQTAKHTSSNTAITKPGCWRYYLCLTVWGYRSFVLQRDQGADLGRTITIQTVSSDQESRQHMPGMHFSSDHVALIKSNHVLYNSRIEVLSCRQLLPMIFSRCIRRWHVHALQNVASAFVTTVYAGNQHQNVYFSIMVDHWFHLGEVVGL